MTSINGLPDSMSSIGGVLFSKKDVESATIDKDGNHQVKLNNGPTFIFPTQKESRGVGPVVLTSTEKDGTFNVFAQDINGAKVISGLNDSTISVSGEYNKIYANPGDSVYTFTPGVGLKSNTNSIFTK